MTQDEIIRMARKAGCDNYGDCYEFVPETLECFAALVAAHERAAYRCDEMEDQIASLIQEVSWMRRKTLEECADWIEKLSPLTKDVKIIAKSIRELP